MVASKPFIKDILCYSHCRIAEWSFPLPNALLGPTPTASLLTQSPSGHSPDVQAEKQEISLLCSGKIFVLWSSKYYLSCLFPAFLFSDWSQTLSLGCPSYPLLLWLLFFISSSFLLKRTFKHINTCSWAGMIVEAIIGWEKVIVKPNLYLGSTILTPIQTCMFFSTPPNNSLTSTGWPTIKLNSDINYLELISDPIG